MPQAAPGSSEAKKIPMLDYANHRILQILIFLFFAGIVNAEEYDHYDYWIYTGNSITIGWDSAQNAIEYEIELYHVEQQVPVAIGRTDLTQITIICPRSGHYYAKIRSIGETENSIWAESSDPIYAIVQDSPRSWWIYCRVAPPTGGTIE